MEIFDFSIIVLCYNPDYQSLMNTISSIFNQKEVTFELVICDDGSSFDYEQKLKDDIQHIWGDAPVKYVFNKQNGGTIRNYLSGIRMSKGEYIKPISPGDYLFNEFSLKRYKDIFSEHNSNIVFSDAIYYSNDKVLNKRQYPANTLVFDKRNMKEMYCVYGYFFLGATLCSKRETVKSYLSKVENSVLYLEDYSMMMMALLDNEKITGINEPLIWYEFGEGISTNSSGNTRIAVDSERVHQYLIENYKDNNILKDALQVRSIKMRPFAEKVILMLIKYPKFYIYKIGEHIGHKQKQFKYSIGMRDLIVAKKGV